MQKYRLTLLFAFTAVAVIAIAAIIVNRVIGNIAEENLVSLAEESTARDALHIESMVRGGNSMDGMTSSGVADSGRAMDEMGKPMQHDMTSEGVVDSGVAMDQMQQPGSLSLDFLAGPEGLPKTFPMLVEGFNVVKLNLMDPNDRIVWSTDLGSIGDRRLQSPIHLESEHMHAGISSELQIDQGLIDLDGASRQVHVVQTYIPLRSTPSGEVIGGMEIYRDVSSDVALQVDDTKSAVLWTTVATMGGLFLALFGFILVADINIQRSRRRAISVVQEANQHLEERVRQRTQELEAANAQLLEAQDQMVRTGKLAAVGQLAGSVAHDLRNPLGAINNAVYYLKRRLLSTELAQANPRIGEFLGIVEGEVEHSNKIITDLLSFSRVSSPSLAPTDLAELVEGTISRLEFNDNVRVVKKLDPELPRVVADWEQLQRVFINLAYNAQDAMPEGGELIVALGREDGYAEIAFRDTGVGIPEEDMKKVFDPLFTTKSNGTGLGLSICQQIVSRQGGSIAAASVAGEGTTFTVRLPLDSDGPQREYEDDGEPAKDHGGG